MSLTEQQPEQIDAHHHLWHYSAAEYPWISERMLALHRDFSADDLEREMKTTGINGSIAVQARGSLNETSALLREADKHPFIRGVVGWVPLTSPTVQDTLGQLRSEPKLKGVRHVLHDEADDHYMLRPDFNAGISALLEYQLVYDILIFEKHLPQTVEFVDRHPHQPFVVDHIAKPRIRSGEAANWSRNLRELAKREHVACKLSGVVTEADWKKWRERNVEAQMEQAMEAFGPSRMLFGSDWPVLLVAASYSEWVQRVRDFISTLTSDEQSQVMGGNAARVYRL